MKGGVLGSLRARASECQGQRDLRLPRQHSAVDKSASKGAHGPAKGATEESIMEVTWSRWHWRENWVENALAETGERQERLCRGDILVASVLVLILLPREH